MRTRVQVSQGLTPPQAQYLLPRRKKHTAGEWKGSQEAERLAEAVLILSRCQRFLRRREGGGAGSQQHPARLPAKAGGAACIPPRLPRAAQEGPATPIHARIRPSKQGDQLLLPRVGARSGVGLGMGCSGSRVGLPKPQAGRGRWVPQGKERGCPCWGGAIRAAP